MAVYCRVDGNVEYINGKHIERLVARDEPASARPYCIEIYYTSKLFEVLKFKDAETRDYKLVELADDMEMN